MNKKLASFLFVVLLILIIIFIGLIIKEKMEYKDKTNDCIVNVYDGIARVNCNGIKMCFDIKDPEEPIKVECLY